MARTSGFRVRGLRQAQAALQRLPDEIADEAVDDALTRASEPTAEIAASLAPADRPVLSRSIGVSKRVNPANRGETNRDRRDERWVKIGPNYRRGSEPYAPHAHFLEFGTGPRYHESGKYVGQTPAQPFMRPAFDFDKLNIIKRFGRLLRPIIDAAARRVKVR